MADGFDIDVDAEELNELWMAREDMNASVRRSAAEYLAIVKATAPEKSGALRSGLVVSSLPENSSLPGKAVYDVSFDSGMNDTFVKVSKRGFRYYYPASQEYGFARPDPNLKKARRKRYTGSDRTPGKYFMRSSAEGFADTFFADVNAMASDILRRKS